MVYEQAGVPLNPKEFPLEHVRLLARLSWTGAIRDDVGFDAALQSTIEAEIDSRIVREVLLQLYLFCGIPTCIRVFSRLYEQAPEAWVSSLPIQEDRTESLLLWQERGQHLFERIYGQVAKRLFDRVAYFHPDLARWMITEGYGKVLMRPGVPVAVRELCIIPVLAVLDHPDQLRSHIRGALRIQAPVLWVQAVLDDCQSAMKAALYEKACGWIAAYAGNGRSTDQNTP